MAWLKVLAVETIIGAISALLLTVVIHHDRIFAAVTLMLLFNCLVALLTIAVNFG